MMLCGSTGVPVSDMCKESCIAYRNCSAYKEWKTEQSWELTPEQKESLNLVRQAYKRIKERNFL